MGRAKIEVLDVIKRHLPQEKRYLVAVSGGKDSITLLDACCKLSEQLKSEFEIAHVDHNLRATSARDAEFVRNLAENYRVKIHTIQAAEPPKTGNIEAWGRELRYKFFADVLQKHELDYVLTAHTASDVAETLLMRLVSNKETLNILEQDERRRCIRPMLTIPRNVIDNYVTENNLSFREDETNQDVSYLRNRVRHHLMPILRSEFNERIDEILATRALYLQGDMLFLKAMVKESESRIACYELFSRKWLRCVKNEISRLDPVLRWRLAEALLMPVVGFALGRVHSERAVEFLSGCVQGVELPNGVVLKAKNGGVLFEKK